MDNKTKPKWYYKNSSWIIGFLVVGPLVLPLVWANPNLSLKKKIVISAFIIIVTYFSLILIKDSIVTLKQYYQAILQ